MKVTLAWLIVRRPSADVMAKCNAACRHAEDRFWWSECWKGRWTKLNALRSADYWMVTKEIVYGCAMCAQFRGAWMCGATRWSSEDFDGQGWEDAVWWAPMHIMEEWANTRQQRRMRTDDTPGLTHKEPMSSGPSGWQGPSGQLEPWTLDSSIRTPVVVPTLVADPTPTANPPAVVNPTPVAVLTPRVHPPIMVSVAVRPPPVHPPPICPLSVCPPPVAHTLGGLFGGELQGLDYQNPPAKWVAQR